jgi:hypothetical protein
VSIGLVVAAYWRLSREFPKSPVVTRSMGGRVGGKADGFEEAGRKSGERASGEKGEAGWPAVGEVGF